MSGAIRKLLLLPHIQIHNANALSSPYTIGFPAMTAWLGAVHALQRKLNASSGLSIKFEATAVVCHTMNLQTYKGPNDFVSSIIGTGNPLEPKSEKDNLTNAVRPSFIEEARCQLDVSLVIEVSELDVDGHEKLCEQVVRHLNSGMKVAGGDILRFALPVICKVEEENQKDMAQLSRKLMPGYCLIERRDLMVAAMEQGQDALEALIDYQAVHHHCKLDDNGNVVWNSQRKTIPIKEGEIPKPPGWIVPISTGFQGITPLGEAKNQRDPETLHRFVESVVTLGEFKMPYRFTNINNMLWRYHYDSDNSLYLCQQAQSAKSINNADSLAVDSIASEFE